MPDKHEYAYEITPIAELTGHDERAWQIRWNPSKPLLASCSADRTVRIYGYHRAFEIPLPTSPSASSAAALPKKNVNAKKKNESALVFSHLSTIPTGHTRTVRSIDWAPGDTERYTFVTASFDSNIAVWERQREGDADEGGGGGRFGDDDSDDGGGGGGGGDWDWECAGVFDGHETECKCVAYSSSGTLLATCSRDKTVWIWEVNADEPDCLAVLMDHSQDVKYVAWHPSEEILASSSYDSLINLYTSDPTDGDFYTFATLNGHTSTVWSLAWSPTGEYLASVSDDRTVRVWGWEGEGLKGPTGDLGSGGYNRGRGMRCVLVIEDAGERVLYGVTWSRGVPEPDSDSDSKSDSDINLPEEEGKSLGWVACAGSDGAIRVWDIRCFPPPPDPTSNPASNHTSKPKRAYAATPLTTLPNAHGVHDINSISFNPRKGFEDVLATAGDDGVVRVWRVGRKDRP